MKSLTDIAADIRRVSPGALPESLGVFTECSDLLIYNPLFGWVPMPDDIAEAVLRDAMVRDGSLAYDKERRRWCGGGPFHSEVQYGGSLQACHAAWRWAKGIDQLR